MGKWLRNAKLASAFGFLILIALIWFAGPYFGLATIQARLIWICFVLLAWVVPFLVGKLVADRAGALLEKVLKGDADEAVMGASPDKRAEVTLLRQRLLSAIDTLKTSKLGKARGKAALYELPWYMIIGHPAAGKSSAIQHSGLTFPFGEKAGVQGVGGTRNCDWFFSTEGVLLDTAGRYSTQREDRPEWLQFLKLLKKHRSRAPVNGILVSVSFPELIQHRSEQFAVYARQVRERINEIDDAFGLKVPVYLLFTKIDLLGGFTQFFEDLSEEERHRIWGATLSHDQGAEFAAPLVVGQQFDALYRGLVQIGTDKLANGRGNVNRPALFAFPIEFHAMREAVCKFVELLFEDDPYHGKPLLRGFYFTSALQEGKPRIAAGAKVSTRFGLTQSGFEAPQPAVSNGFFLRNLFREVVFPDQHLVGRQTKPAGARLRVAGVAIALLLLSIIAAGMTWSYVGNQQLIASAQEELLAARKLAATGQLSDQLKALQVLQLRLEQLHQYRQGGHPWTLSWGLYHGAQAEAALRAEYFGALRSLMLAPVRDHLEQTLNALAGMDLIKRPKSAGLPIIKISEAVRRETAGFAAIETPTTAGAPPIRAVKEAADRVPTPNGKPDANLEASYNALKTYLMLGDRSRMETSHLADQLPRYWQPWLEAKRSDESRELVNRLAQRAIAFYVSQIAEPDLPLVETKAQIVGSSRETLRAAVHRLSAKERVYSELKSRANTQFAPMTVGRMLNNRDLDVAAGSYAVPGAFTREAWEKYFRKAIEEASKGEIKGDDWVLATSVQDNLGKNGDIERNRVELETLYKTEYIREWTSFLQGVSIRDAGSIANAAQVLTRLADPQSSPITLVLSRAAAETSWDNPSHASKTIESAKTSVIERTERLLLGGQSAASEAAKYGDVGARFAVLRQLTTAAEGGRAPIAGYIEQLGKVKSRMSQLAALSEPGAGARSWMQATLNASGSELSDTLTFVDGVLLANATGEGKETVRPLLVRPLMQSYAALIPAVEQDLNRAWNTEVRTAWSSLAAKYPFSDSGNEAPMSEIARFLKPDEGVLAKFINKHLAGIVVRRGESLIPRTWANLGISFNPAFLSGVSRMTYAGTILLQEGDGAKFELQPIPTPGLSEILIEVDGQTLRYRNGPQPWVAFAWPNPTGTSSGARIQVVSFSGEATSVASHLGRLGLMRLLSQANVNGSNSSAAAQLEWRITAGGTPIGKPYASSDSDLVRFNFRSVSGVNPLAFSALRKIGLPEKVTN